MNSDVPLDYAVFQLSPRRTRCELFVSYDGATEKLASGSVKPFVSHLKVAEEQFVSAVKSIKLEVDRHKKEEAWFTKGTLERFVTFVGTPEVLELVNAFNTEMSQLEAARKIYSQGPSDGSGGDGAATTASEATKKELLRAIDVRLAAVGQDLSTACTRASAAGFNPDTVSELHLFADQFGGHRLSEACSKFLSLHQRRPEFSSYIWKSRVDDHALRSSSESDMSIDDWATDSQIGSVLNQHQTWQPKQPDESRITTFQAANKASPAFPLRRSSSRESSIEIEDIKETNDKHEDNKEDLLFAKADSRPPSTRSGPPARQLSVKERINLFETKQKDTTPGSGSKPAAGKSPELSRLPSDVSSAGQVGFEKAVLRRWSGASDMSIDLSGERKDADSRSDTPTSAAAPTTLGTPIIVEDKDRKGSSDTAAVLKPKDISASQNIDSGLKNEADLKKGEIQSKHVRTKSGTQLAVSSGASEEASSHSKLTSAFERLESAGWKDHQNSSEIKSKASFGRAEDFPGENQMTSLDFPRKMEPLSSRGKTASQETATFFSSSVERGSESSAQNTQLGIPLSRYGHDDLSDSEIYQGTVEQEDVEPRNQRVPKSHVRTFQRAAVDMTSSSASPVVRSKPILSQSIESKVEQKLPKSALERESQMSRIDYESAEKQHDTPSTNLEGSGTRSKKFQRHASPSLLVKKSRSRKDDNDPSSSLPGATGKVIADIQQPLPSMSATPMEQAQRVRQSKGNQGLNNNLKMKADELEKLFAEHKLRGPGDQSSATRRCKPAETLEKEASSVYRDSSPELSSSKVASMKMAPESSNSGNAKKSNASPVIQQFENQDYDVTPMQNTYNLGFSDESKGKLYHKYVQKRDAKLKEEWSLKGAEKDARMKAMHDSLERSRSEIKTKLAGSADRLDIHRRTEKLKSYSARSAIRREQLIHSFLSDDNEDQAEFEQDGLTGETSLADTPSRSAQSKSSLSGNVASSTPRTLGLPASRSSAKASASSGGRRKLQSENPLAQSVPSLSGFKKENTKPSTTSSKGVSRPKVSRSKSSSEDALSFKEEKPWRSQHIRKSSATPLDLNDLSLLNSEMVEHEDEFTRSMEDRTFPVKGDTYRYARSKASFPAETVETEDEELVETAKGEDVESFMDEDYSRKDNGKLGGVQGSVLSANLGYENGDALGVPSRANPDSVAEMPAMLPSAFRFMVSALDSPGGSPGSWHSRIHNPFQFQHETSDFDASVDSPIGSPAYWNQPDSDAARMRKKWGAAQKPNVASDSSHSQSRKDVAKGFKRFLKFGRKNRGADSLADWVSVTTSEGDDDTEDGRGDPANRSSDDLRKSRMGFSHYHPSDDGFSETDSFSEQDISKKTFFSFSTLRSKGSDSKPR